MKHAIWLLLGVLCSAMLLFAADNGKKMTGTVCKSSCVVHESGLPTCDPECTDKSGSCVLIGDNGHVMSIVNEKMALPHMGQHVSVMVVPTAEQREESIRIMELYEQAP
jgi:hypothetical protein